MKVRIKANFIFLILLILSATANAQTTTVADDSLSSIHHHHKWTWPEFHYPGKQFFFQGQVPMEFLVIGFRAVAGYQFGQFGIVGGGIGVEGNAGSLNSNNNNDPLNGVYFPVFVHYEGDILRKRVTPYYALDAGYSFRYTSSIPNAYIEIEPPAGTTDHPVYKYYGGFRGGFDFGVKLYGLHKVFATWAVTLDVQQARDTYSDSFYNSFGQYVHVAYSSSAFILTPGIKIGCGF